MDILPKILSLFPPNPSPLQPVTVLASGPVPDGALSIVLSPAYEHPKLFVSDLGKRGLHMEQGTVYDLGSLYTQKQIYDSYELKTWIATNVIIGVATGTVPSKELIEATVTINPGEVEIGAVEIKDGVANIRQTVKSDGTNNASVVIQNFPTPGVALESKQDAGNASLASIDGKVATETTLSAFRSDFGARDLATETTLAGIKSTTDSLTFNSGSLNVAVTGQPIALAGDVRIMNASSVLINPATEETLSTLNLKFNSLGQKLMTGSVPVTIASDQSPLSVSQSGLWDIRHITGTVSLPTGASTLAEQQLQTTRLISLDGKDFATQATLSTMLTLSGFQARINTLGQKTMANSTPVVLASDQSPLAVSQSGNWISRLADGTGNLLTSSLVNTRQALDIHQADTSFVVSGLSAVGAAPTLNPLSVSGIDNGGLKRHIRTDGLGRLQYQPVGMAEAVGLRSYSVARDATLGGSGTETPALLIRNLTGSTRILCVRCIRFTSLESKNLFVKVYRNPTLATSAVTFTDVGDTVNLTAHGYVNGDVVRFATIVTTTGIVINTNYFVVGAAANTFQVSLTSGGPAINLVTNGTGTIFNMGVSLTPQSMYFGGGAPSAEARVSTPATVTSVGSLVSGGGDLNEQAVLDYDWGLLVAAGETLLITATGGSNNTRYFVNPIWSEAT